VLFRRARRRYGERNEETTERKASRDALDELTRQSVSLFAWNQATARIFANPPANSFPMSAI
jgi:hypothetical protein